MCHRVIVDCGAYYPEEKAAIKEYICENNLTPVHLLATHGHLDHNFGNKFIDDEYGLKVELHKDDEDYITHYEKQADKFFQLDVCDKLPPVGRLLEDKDTSSTCATNSHLWAVCWKTRTR